MRNIINGSYAAAYENELTPICPDDTTYCYQSSNLNFLSGIRTPHGIGVVSLVNRCSGEKLEGGWLSLFLYVAGSKF
jgi:hypothetical protein